MPIWLILLLATGLALGLAYCLAMWDANRECRACRIAFFVSGEVVGGWLLFSGWSASSELQFALGSVILLILNLFLGLRYLVRYVESKKRRHEAKPQDSHAAWFQDKSLVAAATGAVAVTAAQALSSDAEKPGPDEESLSLDGGGDLDLDL